MYFIPTGQHNKITIKQFMEPARNDPIDEDDEYEGKVPKKKKSSKEIVVPVVEDDVDLDTVREYLSQVKDKDKNVADRLSSNKATNGSKLADFDSEGMGERETVEVVPVHSHEVKEKVFEEFKRRLGISESKYKQAEEAMQPGNAAVAADPEKALLFATEASSILYEQFVASCRTLEEARYKEILVQKVKCMLQVARLHYVQKNYKESIRELNSVPDPSDKISC